MNKDKIFGIKVKDWATSTLQKIHSWWKKLTDKTVTVTTDHRSTGEKVTNGTLTRYADGTFHAHAKGTDVSIRRPQEALVNELGNEGLVRDGMLHEIEGGAQTIKLKPGDIIFNHKQMEELKKMVK